jgi:hypothetical protein
MVAAQGTAKATIHDVGFAGIWMFLYPSPNGEARAGR